MPKRTGYNVTLRRKDNGEEHQRLILAVDERAAETAAVMRARAALPVMADRQYATFEIVSVAAANPS